MLKFASPTSDASRPCVPNLLPCRINHDGPVDASPRYWAPEIASDGKREAYFRGRKLEGKEVKVPAGYKGVIVKRAEERNDTRKNIENQDARGGEDNEDEAEEKFSMLQDLGSFDKIMLWGHESTVESEDPFVKGIEEWIGFAEAMHKSGKSEGI